MTLAKWHWGSDQNSATLISLPLDQIPSVLLRLSLERSEAMKASIAQKGSERLRARFSRIFKKEVFFERPQAEFQIDAVRGSIHKVLL